MTSTCKAVRFLHTLDSIEPLPAGLAAAVVELLECFPEIEGDIRVDCVKPVTQDLGGGPDIFRLLGNETRNAGIALLQGKVLSGGRRALRDAWVPARRRLDRRLPYPPVPIVLEYPLRGRPPAAVARRIEISSRVPANAGPAPSLSAKELRLPRHLVAQQELFEGSAGKAAGRWMLADEGRGRTGCSTSRCARRRLRSGSGPADWAIGPSWKRDRDWDALRRAMRDANEMRVSIGRAARPAVSP